MIPISCLFTTFWRFCLFAGCILHGDVSLPDDDGAGGTWSDITRISDRYIVLPHSRVEQTG